jgi:cyanophycin synthetase
MNLLRVHGGTFIVDYAHNPAAIEALLQLVREMPATRRIGVLAAPGDRRDEDLRTIGRLGRSLDVVIFKEHEKYRRGRAPGETARIMRDALVEAGFPAARVGYADGEIDGVQKVAALMRPDDVVAYLADDAAEALREIEAMSSTRETRRTDACSS